MGVGFGEYFRVRRVHIQGGPGTRVRVVRSTDGATDFSRNNDIQSDISERDT